MAKRKRHVKIRQLLEIQEKTGESFVLNIYKGLYPQAYKKALKQHEKWK